MSSQPNERLGLNRIGHVTNDEIDADVMLIAGQMPEVGVSVVQRRLRLGYAAASWSLDRLEKAGRLERCPDKSSKFRPTPHQGTA